MGYTLLCNMSLKRIHVFNSREQAFRDDAVLQENVIFHLVKTAQQGRVTITSSNGPEDLLSRNDVPYDRIVHPDDHEQFIHIPTHGKNDHASNRIGQFKTTLLELGLEVSTGRVVDFRARKYLRKLSEGNTVPLIYACHFRNGFIQWPKEKSKKPNAIVRKRETEQLLVPSETYVLVKRFSAKEERRRLSAAVYDPTQVKTAMVGFENHLNCFHDQGKGLDPRAAKGLALYLNSSLLDSYFRQFNGHTQVNATDLRKLKYPSMNELNEFGDTIHGAMPEQTSIDQIVERKGTQTVAEGKPSYGQTRTKRRIQESLQLLKDLGLPREQQNERSALTLLALLDLKPDSSWKQIRSVRLGITQMMRFFETNYSKKYAPNTRETVRRYTVHQFVQSGLVVANPDNPDRPVNSPKAVYEIEPEALKLLRLFGAKSGIKPFANTWL